MTNSKLSTLCLAAIALCACSASEPEQASASPEQASTKPEQIASAWSCPANAGTAPAGVVAAERIHTTEQPQAPGLYEGPVWLDGALYFSDFTFAEGFPSRILKLTLDGQVTTAIPNSGSNGLARTKAGKILAATHDEKALSLYDPATGARELLIGQYRNNPFNSPNDLTLTRNGVIFFTDPDFQRAAAPGGQPKTQVFRVENGAIDVVDDSLHNPNGIALSPAEDVLYVAGGGEQGVLRAYPLQDAVPGEGQDIASLHIPDGLAIDCLGNIYATEHAKRRVRVFSPAGEEIATIELDANVTNVAFGGPQHNILFITGAGAVWAAELQVAGFPY